MKQLYSILFALIICGNNLPLAALIPTCTDYPPDISFCIVDLKYNKPHLKICEFGEGIFSGFKGFNCLNKTKMEHLFQDFISAFNVPLFTSTEQVEQLIAPVDKNAPYDRRLRLAEAGGILLSHQFNFNSIASRAFMDQYPSLIVLDACTRQFVLNKLKTYLLCAHDPELIDYRPSCLLISKQYCKGMARKINQQLKSDYCVIKPINAYKGKGILFVHKNDLEATLATILQPDRNIPEKVLHLLHDQPYSYWQHDKNHYALIESCEHSQPLLVEGKHYDATMRVAFGITYEQGIIDITFFGAYWKLPLKAREDDGSVNQKQLSRIKTGRVCSAPVDQRTYNEVTSILRKILPRIYLKMIIAHHDKEFMRHLTEPLRTLDSQ